MLVPGGVPQADGVGGAPLGPESGLAPAAWQPPAPSPTAGSPASSSNFDKFTKGLADLAAMLTEGALAIVVAFSSLASSSGIAESINKGLSLLGLARESPPTAGSGAVPVAEAAASAASQSPSPVKALAESQFVDRRDLGKSIDSLRTEGISLGKSQLNSEIRLLEAPVRDQDGNVQKGHFLVYFSPVGRNAPITSEELAELMPSVIEKLGEIPGLKLSGWTALDGATADHVRDWRSSHLPEERYW